MVYQETVERSAELLRRALPLMSRQSAGLHPVSYAVWYAYVAHDSSPLKTEVDQILAQHGTLDEPATQSLYRRHLADMDPVVAHRITQGMQQLLAGMSSSAAQASEHTSAFGRSLDRMAAEIRADSSLASEPQMLDTLREQTQGMQQAVSVLQQRLADSQREIEQLRAEVRRARNESMQDALTGLANRRAFDQRVAASLAALTPEVTGTAPVLLMLDIDHFKRINDQWGHGFGDQVLRGVAHVLKALVAEPALAARVGGEEFAVLLPQASVAEGQALAERLREAVAASRVRRKDSSDVIARITVSLGVARAIAGDTPELLVDRADQVLYLAKAGGRDRVVVAD